MDPKTGWRYVQLESPIEFERLEARAYKLTYAQIRMDKTDETPLYHDPLTNMTYYPQCAIYEVDERSRVVISGEPPLQWDQNSSTFRTASGEHYLQFVDSSEFDELRIPILKSIEMDKRQWAATKNSPIYVFDKEYYFPLSAATESIRLARPTIRRKFPLQYEDGMYFDPCTQQKYLVVREKLHFEVLRGYIQRGKKPPKQKPPVPLRSKKKLKHLKFR